MVFKSARQARMIAKHPTVFKKFMKAAKKKLKAETRNKYSEALAS